MHQLLKADPSDIYVSVYPAHRIIGRHLRNDKMAAYPCGFLVRPEDDLLIFFVSDSGHFHLSLEQGRGEMSVLLIGIYIELCSEHFYNGGICLNPERVFFVMLHIEERLTVQPYLTHILRKHRRIFKPRSSVQKDLSPVRKHNRHALSGRNFNYIVD